MPKQIKSKEEEKTTKKKTTQNNLKQPKTTKVKKQVDKGGAPKGNKNAKKDIPKELTKEQRIKKEVERLTGLFKNIPKEKTQLIAELIKRAAFILVITQDMEKEILLCGDYTIQTINAAQEFTKVNPLVKECRDSIKSYQAIIKQLNDLTQNAFEYQPDEPDELDDFINKS